MPEWRAVDGPDSFQIAADDLHLNGSVGSSGANETRYIGAMMGNVFNTFGHILSKTRNILFGVCGKYCIRETASLLPKGGVIGEVAGPNADGAVVAVISDGDCNPYINVTPTAMFKVRNMAGSTSKAHFGLDLSDAAFSGSEYPDISYSEGDIKLSNGIKLVALTTAVTANVTATTEAVGTLALTSHATGAGTLFYSDGSKWQKQP